jgi:hypothetical protein
MQVRELAAESVRAGDATGWFDNLYQAAVRGDAVVPCPSGTSSTSSTSSQRRSKAVDQPQSKPASSTRNDTPCVNLRQQKVLLRVG